MRFDVVTLFPELFAPLLTSGITRRAFETGQVQVQLPNPRDFADGNYRRVDDRPFGGGPGMVMMAEPLARCLAQVRGQRADTPPVVLFSPIGQRLDHAGVQRWAAIRADHAELGWADLPKMLTRLLSLNISGAPFLCADIHFGKNLDGPLLCRLVQKIGRAHV